MKYTYPAVLTPLSTGEYDIKIPDLPGCRTCGKDLFEAIQMAEDAVAMWLWDAENKGEKIPSPGSVITALAESQQTTYIIADTDEYRRKYDNRAVKKTLSIPSWLNTKAEQAGVNFSQLLQDALKARLNIEER